MRRTLLLIFAAAAACAAQDPGTAVRPGTARRGVQPALPPSVSVRPVDTAKRVRTSVQRLFGWRVGLPLSAFRGLTFHDAAARTDELGLTAVQGSPLVKVSAEIPKNLDYELSQDEMARVRHRLDELRLQMTTYDAGRMPPDAGSQKRLFAFAKAAGVVTIIAEADPSSLKGLEGLANEFEVNLAIKNLDPRTALRTLTGLGERIGLSGDTGSWMEQGMRPEVALRLVHDRLLTVNLRDRSVLGPKGNAVGLGRGVADFREFFLEMSRLQPPGEAPWPPKCVNCSGPRAPMRPLLITVDASGAPDAYADLSRSLDAFETAVRPAMGHRVNEIARKTPITPPERVPLEERRKIEAALPRQPAAKPKRARRLLVLDVCPAGSFYHETIAHANLAIELMAKYTGAYVPVFSNDLENLKHAKIRTFDAVFLNSVGGGAQLFADPEVLDGLIRFVREGGGLIGLHGATYASMDLPEFGEMIGAQDGPHRVEKATVKIDDPTSPLTQSFEGRDFEWVDEFYHFLPEGPYSREKLRVLLSINTEKSDMTPWKVRPDNDYGLSWIKSYGKGRVFNCALGHTAEFFATPAIAKFMLAGIQFALGDLEADTTPSAKARREARQPAGGR